MVQEKNSSNQNEVLIKFLAPHKLKRALQELAVERNIALTGLVQLQETIDRVRQTRLN